MRLLVTSDLHVDVPRSRESALEMAAQLNGADADAILVTGDAATSDGEGLEEILSAFDPGRPRLYVPGNHDLWSRDGVDAMRLLWEELPRRVEAAGWHYLPGRPFIRSGTAIVGSPGWYDYGFAWPWLGVPRRFYEAGLSPAAARLLDRHDLGHDADDVSELGRSFVARWNDKRRIATPLSDAAVCERLLEQFQADLVRAEMSGAVRTVVGVHQCPTVSLLPAVPPGPVPPRRLKYAFARAYLGSAEFGRAAGSFPGVSHLVCGHSHVPAATRDDAGRHLLNVGSGYEQKRFLLLDL